MNPTTRKAALKSPVVLGVVAMLIVGGVSSCSPGSPKKTSTFDPANLLPGALADIPDETDIPAPAVMPDFGGMVRAGEVGGANLEAINVITAARAYLASHMDTGRLTSEDLTPAYLSNTANARYYLDSNTGSITRVDSIGGGWTKIVFSLSLQKWVTGAPVGDHENDQDVL